ncbi:family 16 glycosylhydrolase [Belliella sp. R4-6]|uniref:Family 16 glycosylhydrolase n=1 Tax=Belliella alkalica TaxID=1730871 RepID=A0ABS9V7B4_9BACT|nr:family 16 glycosylhydrolase [Belliella alkalica]MCH7412310.1 family 16 glycosylhydrolase [Belliella alkalica]
MKIKIILIATFLFIVYEHYAFAQTKVIAHRGAWKASGVAQNSISGLNAALLTNVDAVELDIRMTADDTLILMHDPSFEGLEVASSTYKDIVQNTLKNQERIPTLYEYFEAFIQNKATFDTKLICEIKPSSTGKNRDIAEKTLDLVNQMGLIEVVVFISFNYEILEVLRALNKDLPLQYLNGDKTPEELFLAGNIGMNYQFKVYEKNPSWIEEAKKFQIVLNTWTVNQPNLMDVFINHSFDYITTDEPEVLMSKIEVDKIKKQRQLVWFDEFDGNGLPDSTKWSFDTRGNDWNWGNNELQWYTDSNLKNAEVSNGTLKITAIKEPTGNKNYSSARLRSLGKGDFKYGYFEIRAKMPKGNGTWPAIWMLPSNSDKGWPEGGEIDIMEHVGFKPDTVFATVHTKAHNHIKKTQVGNDFLLPNATSEFNVYSLLWDEESIKAYVNGICYFTYEKNGAETDVWPFDSDFHLLLNLAIGGGLGGKKGVDNSLFPHVFEVDYVRVYQSR